MKAIRIVALLFVVVLTAGSLHTRAQSVSGFVYAMEEGNQKEALVGATLHWSGTLEATVTNDSGYFSLPNPNAHRYLIVRYVGFQEDTLAISGSQMLEIVLQKGTALKAVEISRRNKTTSISQLQTRKTETLSQGELRKAACCNLSESFETSPSVDVSFTDAVTGTRQIRMLGLDGVYSQITRENMPDIRALSAVNGLTFIPGTWVKSIQLNKGAGSVVNGFESITGQINTELMRFDHMERLFINAYVNQEGRTELNLHTKAKVGKRLSTVLLLHGSQSLMQNDRNEDGFVDMPLSQVFTGLNRWEVANDLGMHIEFGGKYTYIDKLGGQMDFDPETFETDSLWGMQRKLSRAEGWLKLGRVHPLKTWQSTALQINANHHKEEARFGINTYNALQKSFYANLIHQGYLSNYKHVFKTGFSFQADQIEEDLNDVSFLREEYVPGAFFEYNWKPASNFDLVSGIRYDYHNIYGGFITPRMHLRWCIKDKWTLRASGGRGQRTANVIADNLHLLASSRSFDIQSQNASTPYGLDAEVAWNYGLNLTHNFKLNKREGSLSFDFYRTDFENQIIVDVDTDPHKVIFSNLNGSSYANSFQTQLDYEVFERFDLRTAYRFYDVKANYGVSLLEKPLLSRHRAFINLAYATLSKWKFDLTVNWQGEKRIPSLTPNVPDILGANQSPSFFVVNTQITKQWRNNLDIYLGVENLLDYVQDSPILSADNPFGPNFDGTLIWGPVFGRNIYLGMRYSIL